MSDSALGVNYSGYAGPLQLNTNVSTGGTQSFLAYCMDLIHILTAGQTYSLGSVGINNLSLNSSQIHQIDTSQPTSALHHPMLWCRQRRNSRSGGSSTAAV